VGGYTNVKMKEDEEEPVPTNNEPQTTEEVNEPQTTEEVNETEPEPAPEPINCEGKWGPWSLCTAGSTECGEDGIPPFGVQRREWITITEAQNGGKACVYDIKKDGAKACKGVCNKDVQICYSCGYKNCEVFKIGIYNTPLNGVTSIKIPYGRKVDMAFRRHESPQVHVVTGWSGNVDFCKETGGAAKNIQIVKLQISEKFPSEY
jgi:hypothetical protein